MMKLERLSGTYLGKSAVTEKKILTGDVAVHWHTFYELELISHGSCKFIINGKTYLGEKGDMFILNLSDFHEIKMVSPSVELYTIHFNADCIDNSLLLSILQNQNKWVRFSESNFERLKFLADIFAEENQHDNPFQNEYSKSLIDAIAVNVCRNLKRNRNSDKVIYKSPVNLAINYVQLNFQDDLTIKKIAEHIGCSPSYLSRVFHEQVGITLKNYISDVRMEYCAKMLRFSDETITSVCYLSGFGDFSSFYRAFSGKYHCSPREYRKKYLHI